MTMFLVFLISVAASLVMTTTAFGYAIVVMAFLPFILPVGTSTALASAGSVVVLVWSVVKYFKYIDFKLVVFPAVLSTTVAILALVFDMGISAMVYQLMLGILLILLSLWFWKFSRNVRLPINPFTSAVTGVISGICGAFFAINGPPIVLYFNYAAKSKESYTASVQSILFLQTTSLVIMRFAIGIWPAEGYAYLPAMLLGSVVGIIPGKILYSRIDPQKFKSVIYALMCVSGLYFAISALCAV